MQTIARNFTTNNWLPNMRRWDQDVSSLFAL